MPPRTLIVHATHLLQRGFLFVSTDRKSDDGAPTNALYALTGALRRALAFKTPDFAVAVLDEALDVDAFPPLLKPQVGRLEEVLRAHGVPCVHAAEPAHVVASYVKSARDRGHEIVIVGSEKRLAQLVGDGVWWYDAYKDVRYTLELVRKRFEVLPAEVAGWLALVGDDDVLPGIDGLGKKGATDLVKTYGSIAAAIERADEVAGRPGKMLRASLDAAKGELQRATLDLARPLPEPLDRMPYAPPTAEALNELYRSLAFSEMLGSEASAGGELDVVVCDTEDAARAAIDAWGDALVTLHALTEDPSPVRGALAGLAATIGGGRVWYFPLLGRGRCLDGPGVLAGWLSDASKPKVGHDLKIVTVAMARLGVTLAGVAGDSVCASHLTEPSGWAPHDLPIVAKLRLKRALVEEETVRGVGRAHKAWAALPIDKAASFAAQCVEAASALWASFAPEAREPASETRNSPPPKNTVPRALLDEYLELTETLVRAELHGIVCDAADLQQSGEDFTRISSELETKIHALAGKPFNLGSTKQLGAVLYEELGLPIVKKTKTGWSTATEALERIEHAHPIVSMVMRWRELERLKGSWVVALQAAIDADGRVRSTFHPARSFSGRIVNSQPDLGRVPGRTTEMARIRHAFRAPPGWTILSLDYAQLGLHVLAHLTKDPALVEPLRRRDDLHRLTAAAVLDLPVESVSPDQRQTGKVVNFATFAGQGASSLGQLLGLAPAESKQLIERFDRRYAVVRAFQDEQLRLVQERGYIETLAGRRWPIGGLGALDPMLRSYAERLARRATHEGSVADVSRRGLLRADQALRAAGMRAIPLLQVHDEVLFEVPDDELVETARVAGAAMRGAFDLEVPLSVGCEAGPSWGEIEPLRVE